jgi:hypothetical protein
MIDGQAIRHQIILANLTKTQEYGNLSLMTGTYGTNGFYLEFKDSSALGDDTSGNSNDFTVNNLTSIDQTTDTPTNNFCYYESFNRSFWNCCNIKKMEICI